MHDTSPESWAHGAVDRLLFITRALSYFEYKAKRKHGSGAEFPSLEKLCHLLFPLCSILCQFASTNLFGSLFCLPHGRPGSAKRSCWGDVCLFFVLVGGTFVYFLG